MQQSKVALSSKLADEYKLFAKEAGISLERAVHEALDGWMETEGSSLYADLVKRRKGRSKIAKVVKRKAA